MDILAALAAAPAQGKGRCKLQRHLDSIPDDADGYDTLMAAINDAKAYPSKRVCLVMKALELPVGEEVIQDHRAERCACFRS